jgi:hypothetical protein
MVDALRLKAKPGIMDLAALPPVAQAFCLALADDTARQAAQLPDLLARVGEDSLWDFSMREGSASIVASALITTLGPGHVSSRWQQVASEVEIRLTLYLQQLDRVAVDLAAVGVRLVALKNSGIARAISRNLAGCPMGDIDVLVAPPDFRRAHERMKALGFTLASRSPLEADGIEQAEQHGGAEYTYPLADGSALWFELQWRPIAGRWIQPDQEPKAGDLLARSVPIPGSAARLLCPEDNLLQVCLHTAKHSYVRAPGFRLHTDVDRIVRRCPVDWAVFLERVAQTRVRTAVYFSLELPRQLLQTPIPEWVLLRLRPPSWKRRWVLAWLQRVGLFDPNRPKWSKPGYIVFNLLLYDDWRGILRALFPTGAWMRQRYGFAGAWQLPFWYLRRAADLVLKRANT